MALQPLAGVVEHRDLDGLDVLGQHLVDVLDRELLALADEAHLLHGWQQQVVLLLPGQPDHHAHLHRQPVGQRRHRAEVDDGHPTVGHQHEIARVGVTVHHADPGGRVEGQLEKPCAADVPLLRSAVADDLRERDPAVDPLADHHLRRAAHHVRDQEVRVAVIGLGERALVVGLQPVVQLHLGALDEFVDHALHVGARGQLPEHAGQPPHGLEVGAQSLVGAGVLDLDGHRAAVAPHPLVHLADAGRGHRGVVELGEPFTPLGAQLSVEHPVNLGRRQRRGVLLQFGQGLAVGGAVLLGDGGLEHRERLAHFHGAALELAEHAEQLLGGLVHQLGVDLVAGLAGQPFGRAESRPARDADRDAGQLGVAAGAAALDVVSHALHHPRRAR